jgi:hypothetical protein
MGNQLIREGRKYLEYSVYLHAGNLGEATKVRLGSRDRWVGDDYWYFNREYEPSRKDRAFSLMSRFENCGQTDSLRYWVARAVVLHEIGHPSVAKQHINLWREKHGPRANDNVQRDG